MARANSRSGRVNDCDGHRGGGGREEWRHEAFRGFHDQEGQGVAQQTLNERAKPLESRPLPLLPGGPQSDIDVPLTDIEPD